MLLLPFCLSDEFLAVDEERLAILDFLDLGVLVDVFVVEVLKGSTTMV